MKQNYLKLARNHGGPLHYLGNRFLTLPDLSGHMQPDNSWLEELFLVLRSKQKKKYKTCFEPFAGCASWSMAAMEFDIAEEYIINDSNQVLIHTLQLIRDNSTLIKNAYENLVQQYHSATSKKNFFLNVISNHNQAKTIEEKSVLLPFIINHSWSGILFYDDKQHILYREANLFEGKKAERFLEQANLSIEQFCEEVDRASKLFNNHNVSFRHGDFLQLIAEAGADDLVGLNPPYPENERSEQEKMGMYLELYGPQTLHQHLLNAIKQLEEHSATYYLTYGFYNPNFKESVFLDHLNKPKNYFRILGYDGCAFGVGLDQMYFSSKLAIPQSLQSKIMPAQMILEDSEPTPEEALARFKALAKTHHVEQV